MNKVFTCLRCGYIFVADKKTDKCIDCAKEIREANADEINELNLRSKKGKVYVQVAFGDPYSTPCWYEDEKRECKVKDLVAFHTACKSNLDKLFKWYIVLKKKSRIMEE